LYSTCKFRANPVTTWYNVEMEQVFNILAMVLGSLGALLGGLARYLLGTLKNEISREISQISKEVVKSNGWENAIQQLKLRVEKNELHWDDMYEKIVRQGRARAARDARQRAREEEVEEPSPGPTTQEVSGLEERHAELWRELRKQRRADS
jgi:hypothetical protein